MWDIAPDHALGLYAGIVAFPIALILLRLMRSWHRVPATARAASVLMAVAGAIHIGLVPSHLEERVTAVLFVMNGVAYIFLSLVPAWRWWRPAAFSLITATLIGYLFFIVFGFDTPDQVALTTKLIELTALGLVLVPVKGGFKPRDPARYWATLAVLVPVLTVMTGTTVWVLDLLHPNALHAHAGALVQSTNAVATPQQVAAAQLLYDETATAIAPYKDWHVAWAAGYRPGPADAATSTHWTNQTNVDHGYVLDPHRPQGLVYANTHHGPVLLGAMFQMKHLNQFGPDPGGPLTAWHQHENICLTPFGLELSFMTPFAVCPVGAIDFSAAPMLHVWIVDNPGGQFAIDIDSAVVARIDRT